MSQYCNSNLFKKVCCTFVWSHVQTDATNSRSRVMTGTEMKFMPFIKRRMIFTAAKMARAALIDTKTIVKAIPAGPV